MGAHEHFHVASCVQEFIFDFSSAFGLGHWTIYYLGQEACVLVCSHLYLVNNFNGPPKMFFSLDYGKFLI